VYVIELVAVELTMDMDNPSVREDSKNFLTTFGTYARA
jgi:hypothetical protein